MLVIFSTILFLVDVGSDVSLAIKYGQEGEWWWFGLTPGFVVAGILVVNISVAERCHIRKTIALGP